MKNTARILVAGRHAAVTAARSNAANPPLLRLAQPPLIPVTILKRLALSESGFVFDPVSGQSFTVNETGLAILRLAQIEEDAAQLAEQLTGQFEAPAAEIRRDVLDFAERLKEFFK